MLCKHRKKSCEKYCMYCRADMEMIKGDWKVKNDEQS